MQFYSYILNRLRDQILSFQMRWKEMDLFLSCTDPKFVITFGIRVFMRVEHKIGSKCPNFQLFLSSPPKIINAECNHKFRICTAQEEVHIFPTKPKSYNLVPQRIQNIHRSERHLGKSVLRTTGLKAIIRKRDEAMPVSAKIYSIIVL